MGYVRVVLAACEMQADGLEGNIPKGPKRVKRFVGPTAPFAPQDKRTGGTWQACGAIGLTARPQTG